MHHHFSNLFYWTYTPNNNNFRIRNMCKKHLTSYSTTMDSLVTNLKKNSNWRDISVYQILHLLLFLYIVFPSLKSTSVHLLYSFSSFSISRRGKRQTPRIPLNLNCVRIQACMATDKKPFLTVSVIIFWKSGGDNKNYSTKGCCDSTFFVFVDTASCRTRIFLTVLSSRIRNSDMPGFFTIVLYMLRIWIWLLVAS